MKSFSRVFAALASCSLALLASSATLTAAAQAHHTHMHTLHATVHADQVFCDEDEDIGEGRVVLNVHICHLARLLNDTDGVIDVSATYRCSGATLGKIVLTVNQTAQQSGNGHATTASGTQDVNCDDLPHKIGIPSFPVPGNPGFNLGPAFAQVTLTAPSGAVVSDTEWIQIVA